MHRLFILGTISLAACVVKSENRVFEVPYKYTDALPSKEFVLEYHNKESKSVCLAAENWPNSSGKINQASSRVWVNIAGDQYNLRDFNTGYCSDCLTKVRPGQTVVGRIPYEEFRIPLVASSRDKVLHFRPTGFFCRE